ncbi:hypothetical protein GQ44DRAFT_722955 [Phaeosphaeriaceae sp. PMI808]|nr:hypothetical protein GQ44DRAFT_722955 [Phaeosphaeriaceae sp. PMI808]
MTALPLSHCSSVMDLANSNTLSCEQQVCTPLHFCTVYLHTTHTPPRTLHKWSALQPDRSGAQAPWSSKLPPDPSVHCAFQNPSAPASGPTMSLTVCFGLLTPAPLFPPTDTRDTPATCLAYALPSLHTLEPQNAKTGGGYISLSIFARLHALYSSNHSAAALFHNLLFAMAKTPGELLRPILVVEGYMNNASTARSQRDVCASMPLVPFQKIAPFTNPIACLIKTQEMNDTETLISSAATLGYFTVSCN